MLQLGMETSEMLDLTRESIRNSNISGLYVSVQLRGT